MVFIEISLPIRSKIEVHNKCLGFLREVYMQENFFDVFRNFPDSGNELILLHSKGLITA